MLHIVNAALQKMFQCYNQEVFCYHNNSYMTNIISDKTKLK